MVTREVFVRAPDVVFVKGLVEASDGLASVFAERGGDLILAVPHGREAELAELLHDLEVELGARLGEAWVDGGSEQASPPAASTRPGGPPWDQPLRDR
jgi:hypothetical protein